ncbi:MAG: putative membrane protein [Myxococcota bacterium]
MIRPVEVGLTILRFAAIAAYPICAYLALRYVEGRWALAVLVALVACPIIIDRFLTRGADRPNETALKTTVVIPILSVILLTIGAAVNAHGLALLVPVIINGVLLFVFGTTLLRGPPIIERFARAVDPDLTVNEVHWCRGWTAVWCAYFALNATMALVLAMWFSLYTWGLYNGLISYIIMALLFVSEYAARKWRFGRFRGHWPDRALAGLYARLRGAND